MIVPRLMVLASVLASVPVCGAPPWDWEYSGERLPEETRPGLRFIGDPGARDVGDGALHVVNEARYDGLWASWIIRDIGAGHSAMNHRVNGWIMWVTGATGYYFDNGGVSASLWDANAWHKIGRACYGSTPWGAGDQLYPNENMCGFCSSIRFELTREAYEDYEYFATLAELSQQTPLTDEQSRLVQEIEEAIVPLYCWWRDGRDPDVFWQEAVHEGQFESDAKRLYWAREQLGELIHDLARRTTRTR